MIDVHQRTLYSILTDMGDCFDLDFGDENKHNNKIKERINTLEWQKYNPRKDIKRFGVSCTSLTGEIEEPSLDLDSLFEYNKINGTHYDELSFTKPTKYFDLISPWVEGAEDFIGRSHIIKLGSGGYFPNHRDLKLRTNSFRLFLPIVSCNLPDMAFIVDKKILDFSHGRLYFINTAKEHVVANFSSEESVFAVVNMRLCEESVKWVAEHLSAS